MFVIRERLYAHPVYCILIHNLKFNVVWTYTTPIFPKAGISVPQKQNHSNGSYINNLSLCIFLHCLMMAFHRGRNMWQ